MLHVLDVAGLVTVQDAGRPGLRALGVPGAGAADAPAYALGNRLVGNEPGAAALELGVARLLLRAWRALTLAVTGAPRALSVDGRAEAMGCAVMLRAGQSLLLEPPAAGVYSYVAVRGGLDVPPELGSRSTDLLSGLGPPVLRAGDVLPLGVAGSPVPGIDVVALPPVPGPHETVVLHVLTGPRADWCMGAAAALCAAPYVVSPLSNRVALRLEGQPVRRSRSGELPPEALLPGAVQVPPDGRPVLFLVDAPTTGGYPVVAVVVERDLPRAAQLRPGQSVVLRHVGPGGT